MKKIVGRDLSPSSEITWIPDDGSFPMKHSVSGNRLGGSIALLIGSLWVYFFIDDIFKALKPVFLPPELLMMVLITLPGLLILIFGIRQFVYHEETVIDRNHVSWKRRGLIRTRQWREAIPNYQGVLKDHFYWHGERRSNYMSYLISLDHADYRKVVLLYKANSTILVPPVEWTEKWKRFAELLQLPVLEKTESGIKSSDVYDLEQPLINKIRDGKRKFVHINPQEAVLGRMAKLTREDDLWVITCYPVWTSWKSIVGMIALIVLLLGSYAYGLIDPKLFRYALLIVPLCIIAIGLSIRKHIARPEQLALDKKYLYYRYWKKQKGFVTDDIPLHSISDISVKSNPMHFRSAADIVIEGKKRSIRFGWWLPNKTKLRLESILLSLMADDLDEN